MKNDDEEDSGTDNAAPEVEGYVAIAQALELSMFTVAQLRALVTAGVVRTVRAKQNKGALLYCVEDLQRFDGAPRSSEPEEQSPLLAEVRAITEGYRGLVEAAARVSDLALKQTKQAQDHERLLITAFAKPLENVGDASKSLVVAVLDQNKQLVERANAGDKTRLDFVQAAEGMLKDQRGEMREQLELDRKHAVRLEVWEGVKKAGPHLLEGLKATFGTGGDQLKAALQLKEKFDIGKVAALASFMTSEETDLLCKAFGYDRAELDRINAEATAAAAESPADAPTEPPPADAPAEAAE